MTLQRALTVLLALAFMMPTVYFLLKALLGVTGRFVAAVWCAPPIAILLIVNYRLHLHLLLLGFVLPFTLPPILGHRPISFATLIPMIVFASAIARLCLGHRSRVTTDRRLDMPLLLISGMIIGWNIADRPGMASMGAETGGAWEAVLAVAGIAAYWGARALRDQTHNWRRISVVLFWACVLSLLWVTLENIVKHVPVSDAVSNLFWPTGWWFYGLLLGYTIKVLRSRRSMVRDVPMLLTIGFIMFNAIMSGFRSRILFAPMMIAAALWAGGLRRRMAIALLIFIAACLLLANSGMFEKVPARARRVLSVVRVDTQTRLSISMYGHGEMGWKSQWRAELWKRGWQAVREKPFAGRGYAFDSSGLLADLASATTFYEATMRGVATAGQFHNLPLNLMFFCGIPVAVLFCFAWIVGLVHLVRLATESGGWKGAFLVAMLVYIVPETGQALMNGSGEDFIAICTWLGIIQAIRSATLREAEEKKAEQTQAADGTIQSLTVSELDRAVPARSDTPE